MCGKELSIILFIDGFFLFIFVYWIGMFTCNMVGMSKKTSKIKIKKLN